MESGGIDSRDSHLPSTTAPASEHYNDYGANEYNVNNNGSSNNAVFFLNEQRKAALADVDRAAFSCVNRAFVTNCEC